MTEELFFIGEPYQFLPGINIYPPKVRDVVTNQNFGIYGRILTYSQEEVEDEFIEAKQPLDNYPTPLEFLLNNSYHSQEYRLRCEEAFEFFLHTKVTFLYELKRIVIGELSTLINTIESIEELVMLDEDNFFDFQNVIREAIGKKKVEKPDPNESPEVARIKRKARMRDKLKAKQAAKNNKGISFYTSLVSICCMGVGVSPLNIGEMSYVAVESIMRKYQEKEKYQLDIDSLLAGADSKKVKPQYWIRNFED